MRDSGLLDATNAVLVAGARIAEGRAAEPTAGIIDSQSVKTTETGGPRGYDAGKKIKGRKRHIATDTTGSLLDALVLPAGVQDRDAAPGLLERCRDAYPGDACRFCVRVNQLLERRRDYGDSRVIRGRMMQAPSRPVTRQWCGVARLQGDAGFRTDLDAPPAELDRTTATMFSPKWNGPIH